MEAGLVLMAYGRCSWYMSGDTAQRTHCSVGSNGVFTIKIVNIYGALYPRKLDEMCLRRCAVSVSRECVGDAILSGVFYMYPTQLPVLLPYSFQ